MEKNADRIAAKQKKLYWTLIGSSILVAGLVVFSLREPLSPVANKTAVNSHSFDVISKEINPEHVRLASLENLSDVLTNRMQSLEKSILDLKEENLSIEEEKSALLQETRGLREKIKGLEEEINQKSHFSPPDYPENIPAPEIPGDSLRIWGITEAKEEKNVLFEIPAGTVVKAILVSGADCSVAVQKPTGPNMVLLRPLDHGKLPRNVSVPLKGSILIGNAIGDISSERVYIRAERLTLVERNGSFVETEVSAYISGEDGKEGMRGVVVDRSGQIIARAGVAAFLQGIGQTVQATLNNQVIEKLAETTKEQTILNVDLLRNSALQGSSTAVHKLADYYIKRAEQLQPAIQIAAGRVVDIVFTKTVKVGEKDLKKKFERERERRSKGDLHG